MSQTVLITGASNGIGKACARVFARKGYDLVLLNVDPVSRTLNKKALKND